MLFYQLLAGILTRIFLTGKKSSVNVTVSDINVAKKSDIHHVVVDLKDMLIPVSHTSLVYLTTYDKVFGLVKMLNNG